MKIFIAVGMPYGDDEMVVEVVDDMDCFSPSLLGKYPITEMDSENLYTDPQDYAREHKQTLDDMTQAEFNELLVKAGLPAMEDDDGSD